ncbi:universal stress protein [Actinoplanes xinjiangensis]|uniref:Nucleotide-binding universal stress UspA family protein n=1 Tax=Actinoplanes xinjiangensis TaxID=512350 RepID=A0A316F4Y3_9ACTN|nr:universal stress protein [Actinoplanes xinjiangensis]PWK39431.1 nucleotide-binding universal stress UspA family protein [Actinoplanes xinjiangensis]GIF42706.1 universal stress protein [Actinoplanes xinjiangensis]
MPAEVTETAARIVVGVDGSPGSKVALTWAMGQAKLTGAVIEAVTAWQDPAIYGTAYGWTSVAFEGDTYAMNMTKVLDDTIAEVADGAGTPVTVIPRVVQGHPVEALLKAATGARLLVLGSRGHGTFAGSFSWSVTSDAVSSAEPAPETCR